jgi:hypothetical protein
MGFGICFSLGYLIAFFSFRFFIKLIEGNPLPFAFNYSFGHISQLLASTFLCGPKRQFKYVNACHAGMLPSLPGGLPILFPLLYPRDCTVFLNPYHLYVYRLQKHVWWKAPYYFDCLSILFGIDTGHCFSAITRLTQVDYAPAVDRDPVLCQCVVHDVVRSIWTKDVAKVFQE